MVNRRQRVTALTALVTCLALAGLGLLAGFPHGFGEAALAASAGAAVLAAGGFAAVTLLAARPVPGRAALGTGPTAVAYPLYFRGLRFAAASTGALLTLLEPLTAAVLAALVLGDRLGVTGIAGATLLAAAVVLTTRARSGRLGG